MKVGSPRDKNPLLTRYGLIYLLDDETRSGRTWCNEWHRQQNLPHGKECKRENIWFWGGTLAQWIHLCLPSCRPGFESQSVLESILFIIYTQICAIFEKWKEWKYAKNTFYFRIHTHQRERINRRFRYQRYQFTLYLSTLWTNNYIKLI